MPEPLIFSCLFCFYIVCEIQAWVGSEEVGLGSRPQTAPCQNPGYTCRFMPCGVPPVDCRGCELAGQRSFASRGLIASSSLPSALCDNNLLSSTGNRQKGLLSLTAQVKRETRV